MPSQEPLLWTTARKTAGNLIPLILVLPFFLLGAREALEKGITPYMALWLILLLLTGWISVGLFGFIGNGHLRHEMGLRFHKAHPFDPRQKFFVGFARPVFKGLLDAHEDIGFLLLGPETLEFFGELKHIKMARGQIETIRFRANPHSWLALGRWISIEGHNGEQEFRMLIEPRVKATLFGNYLFSIQLKERLDQWKIEEPKMETAEPSALRVPPMSE